MQRPSEVLHQQEAHTQKKMVMDMHYPLNSGILRIVIIKPFRFRKCRNGLLQDSYRDRSMLLWMMILWIKLNLGIAFNLSGRIVLWEIGMLPRQVRLLEH